MIINLNTESVTFLNLELYNPCFCLPNETRVDLITLYVSFTEEAARREWSIDEATGKFQSSVEKNY